MQDTGRARDQATQGALLSGTSGEAFEAKMAEVLCVYREVAIIKQSEGAPANVAIVSYDEKPGI